MSVNVDSRATKSGYCYEAARAASYVVMFGLVYGYLNLSTNPVLLKIGFIVLALLQLARVIVYYEGFSKLGLGFEIAFLTVLLFGIVSSYGWNLRAHPIYTSVLIFRWSAQKEKV